MFIALSVKHQQNCMSFQIVLQVSCHPRNSVYYFSITLWIVWFAFDPGLQLDTPSVPFCIIPSSACVKKLDKFDVQLTVDADLIAVSPTEMVVTWVTTQSTSESVVEYGVKILNQQAKGHEDVFIDGGSEKRLMYIHRVTISGLTPGQKYCEYL